MEQLAVSLVFVFFLCDKVVLRGLLAFPFGCGWIVRENLR
jgi:hypothetical protein